jgi:hypothetical protein
MDLFYPNKKWVFAGAPILNISRSQDFGAMPCVVNRKKTLIARHGNTRISQKWQWTPVPEQRNLSLRNLRFKRNRFGTCDHSRFPQKQWFIEAMVKAVKAILKKNEDPNLALLRNTEQLL